MTGFQWIAVAFVTIWFLALVIERVIDAAWNYCFQVDGNHSAGLRQNIQGCTQTETPVSTLTTVGGPFAVDASNGPNVEPLDAAETEKLDNIKAMLWSIVGDDLMPPDEHRRLAGLIEFHKITSRDPVVPPPSRAIRRSIH